MKRTDTEIHIIELLLTLDYLVHHTDENHPASQIDICRHARNFDLVYNDGQKGDDVKRQRIATCLKVLSRIYDEHFDRFPFILERTASGKYYVEQRNGLDETQTAALLAAIENDKYTKNEDVQYLKERIYEAFSTTDEYRDIINREYRRLVRGVSKFDKETIRKINLIEKAYREQRLIKVRMVIYDKEKPIEFFFWYRVYLMKELQGKPYAFLIPASMNIGGAILDLKEKYIFRPIESIDIPNLPQKEVLNYDEDENQDFNDIEDLFAKQNPSIIAKYRTLDNFIQKTISPMGGGSTIVSFYFNLNVLSIIKHSFEHFFVEKFTYQESNLIAQLAKKIGYACEGLRNAEIVAEDIKPGEKAKYGVVNISVNPKAFQSWLLSDPFGDGTSSIASLVHIIKPDTIRESLARYYARQFIKYSDSLSDEEVQKIMYGELSEEKKD